MFRESERIVFEAAEGRISAEEIAFYPPGIPIILPGERITRELIDYIKETAALGLRVTGPQDTSLKTLRVLR
jgi:arginine decarboxylase